MTEISTAHHPVRMIEAVHPWRYGDNDERASVEVRVMRRLAYAILIQASKDAMLEQYQHSATYDDREVWSAVELFKSGACFAYAEMAGHPREHVERMREAVIARHAEKSDFPTPRSKRGLDILETMINDGMTTAQISAETGWREGQIHYCRGVLNRRAKHGSA